MKLNVPRVKLPPEKQRYKSSIGSSSISSVHVFDKPNKIVAIPADDISSVLSMESTVTHHHYHPVPSPSQSVNTSPKAEECYIAININSLKGSKQLDIVKEKQIKQELHITPLSRKPTKKENLISMLQSNPVQTINTLPPPPPPPPTNGVNLEVNFVLSTD